jgi:hypothetical protein
VAPYLFVLPHLIFFALFAAYPLVYGLSISLFNFDLTFPDFRPFVGLDNYHNLIDPNSVQYDDFWRSMRNTGEFLVWSVPPLVVVALLVATSAPARGAVTALAALTKFAPLGLGPVLATHGLAGLPWRRRLARVALFSVAFAVVTAGLLLLFVDDLGTFWDRTIGFQSDRGAPFSIWGLYELDTLQRVAQVLAVLVAVGVALVPRRADERVRLAALCAAVLIALQLAVTYWFYLYLVWFFPLVMLAVLAPRPPWRPSTA